MTCLTAEQSLGSGREVDDDGRGVEDGEGGEGAQEQHQRHRQRHHGADYVIEGFSRVRLKI